MAESIFDRFQEELANDKRTVAELIDDALAEADSDEGTALAVLTFRGTHDVFIACEALCRNADPARRSLGAHVLGQFGFERNTFLDESLAILIPMLEDDVPDVAATTAIALGYRADDRAITPLLSQIAHRDSGVRRGVACALGRFGRPDAIAGLITLSRDDAAPVRDWATTGLYLRDDVDTPEIREALADRLNDEDAEVRGYAMLAMAMRKDPRAIDAIRTELASDELEGDWVFEAAELLADQSLYDDLLEWLDEDEPNRHFTAALDACRAGKPPRA